MVASRCRAQALPLSMADTIIAHACMLWATPYVGFAMTF